MENVEKSSLNLMEEMKAHDIESGKKVIREFLGRVENDATATMLSGSSEFFGSSNWINCDRSLNVSDFTGRLVLADFFTYCCINCIHIMPFLHNLESTYKTRDGLLVIGVHSAKFPNEKWNENIRNAISRYNIKHPVVNDCEIKIWNEFSVTCWPTLMLFSPTGKVLFSIPGESHTDFVKLFIEESLKFYDSKNLLNKTELSVNVFVEAKDASHGNVNNLDGCRLRFPGKVAVDDEGLRIAISDTGNNRVIIAHIDGRIIRIIGGNGFGFVDGIFENAKFNSPQGVAWHGANTIFVADCDNHAIRKIDLLVKRVVTVAGTGVQGSDLEGGKTGLDQMISSPWDVVFGGSPRSPDAKSLLYIAMSGCHQIWVFFLKTTDYQKGAELEMSTCIRYAGSGNEENRNNSYPHKAGFAQPSGLVVDEFEHAMYVADSESSTIRKINLSNGAVQALVGGDIDPMNLFSFGDVDGKGREAKLQHPTGIACDGKRKLLYVADTYNHKLKVVDPKKKTCYALLESSGKMSVFNEPSGLSLDPSCENLYVADTNNHDIKIISLEDLSMKSMILKDLDFENLTLEDTDGLIANKPAKPLTGKNTVPKILDKCVLHKDGTIKISLTYHSFHLNEEAPSAWQMSCQNSKKELIFIQGGQLESSGEVETNLKASLLLTFDHALNNEPQDQVFINVFIESLLYYCLKDSDTCMMHSYKALIPFCVISDNASLETDTVVKLEIS